MPILLLLVLAVPCLLQSWPAPPDDGAPGLWALLSLTPLLGVLAATFVVTRWVRHRLRMPGADREAILSRYHVFHSLQIGVLILAYGLTLFAFGWGWAVKQFLTVGDGPGAYLLPGAELGVLAPFILGLFFSWACFFDVDRAAHEAALAFVSRPFWTRWDYVLFHARQNLALVVAPLTLLVVYLGLARFFPDLRKADWVPFVAYGLVIVVLLCLPWVLRLVLGLKPLPPGPLRERLLAAAHRLRFRCSDILLWNTHGLVANAMVVGVLPVPRYVILSDRLLAGLRDEEVEAVFGHEVGHIKHYHMTYYLGFLLTSTWALAGLWGLVADVVIERVPEWKAYLAPGLEATDQPNAVELSLLPLMGLYLFVVFGFLSRRCERQADIFGCRAVSCDRPDCTGHAPDVVLQPEGRGLCPTGIQTFIRALEKVAHLNGMSSRKAGWLRHSLHRLQSWLHPTIACRVEFLQHMLIDPSVERRFQKRVGLVKWGLLLGLAVLLVILCNIP